MQHGRKIAETDRHGFTEAHILKGLRLHGDGIVIEFGIKQNSGNTMPLQHDAVGLFRIRAACFKRRRSSQHSIVHGSAALHREHLFPPFIDLGHLGKETVTAHIHTIALVIDGFGNAADGICFLQHGDFHILCFC